MFLSSARINHTPPNPFPFSLTPQADDLIGESQCLSVIDVARDELEAVTKLMKDVSLWESTSAAKQAPSSPVPDKKKVN